MLIAIAIVLAGLLLIYLEFFVPGGILAVLGSLACLFGLFLFIWQARSLPLSLLFIALFIATIVGVIKLALAKIKKRPALFADENQAGYIASAYDEGLIGKEGVAVTDLKSSGHISVEGEHYQAVSESSYIKKGDSLTIVGGEGARLIVRKRL